ncbi:MAG: hypothetical protein LBV12_11255 [Puniceicoccales bacterium]|jgi:pyruvate,water dikinase|nr:hypothetical protein [Puniceicoccales bacterium]
MSFIAHGNDADISLSRLGGKAGALARLSSEHFPVPEWFVVTPDAFSASINESMLSRLGNEAEAPGLLAHIQPSAEVATAIAQAVARVQAEGGSGLWAVRSSAVDEDGGDHSFAGQLESFLSVPATDISARVADVWRSGFSSRVYAYRRERGLSGHPTPPAVLVQRMITADCSGVVFGADPVSGSRGTVVVSGLYGLGTALVSGDCDADTWRVRRDDTIIDRQVAPKPFSHRSSPTGTAEGTHQVANPDELVDKPCLNDAEVLQVAALARKLEKKFGRPQDIEWAMQGGKLWLLQSRPITSLAGIPDPDGIPNLWDNSNIAESYNGVTTPLTYSFARGIYEEVYKQFCRIMRVPEVRIEENRDVFPRMLGLIHGRIYYNLLSWYQVLAMLPGYAVNSRFMEQMMGVKEPLPTRFQPKPAAVARWKDLLGMGNAILGLFWNNFTLPRSIKRFYARLDSALNSGETSLEKMRLDELAAHFRNLERQLLTRWDAPLVNDFFAMVFYGLLRHLCKNWCDDTDASLQNNLLCGEGGMISAEPALRVREMAQAIAGNSTLIAALCDGSDCEAESAAWQSAKLAPLFTAYLDKFGERCIGELKLESLTLHEDPMPLLRSIGRLARSGIVGQNQTVNHEQVLREEAEKRVREKLRPRVLRRKLFGWVLRHARDRVRDRENLRFERTRLFGRVRRIFMEIGRRLTAEGKLAEPRDIFYLTTTEVLGFIEGTAASVDLRGMIQLRQVEFAAYREAPAPSDRFETNGAVHVGNTFTEQREKTVVPDSDTLQGIGCCPGIVQGRARVILQPEGAFIEPGEILVAPRTDPGWIMLFPSAAGLLVEHGSLLSHAAIVTREMGIPSVVALPGLTSWIKTGDLVELDGRTGSVKKIL